MTPTRLVACAVRTITRPLIAFLAAWDDLAMALDDDWQGLGDD